MNALDVRYATTPVIRGVSDTWQAGQLTALIGCNGAGKSTLLKALAGLLPSTGDLWLDGAALHQDDRNAAIAYMPQDTGAASSLTVLEVVLLGRLRSLGMRVPIGLIDEALHALDTFGLITLQTRRLDEISGGQRQLVFLTQALFRAPRVLLLDEPTAALDLRHQLLVLEELQRLAATSGTVIAMALHDLNLAAQFADRMIGLHAGQAFATGIPEEVLTGPNLRTMYGIEAEITLANHGCLQVLPMRAAVWPGSAA